MTGPHQITNLATVLDRIWHSSPDDRSHLSRQVVGSLSEFDWLLLAAWDTSATFGPEPGIAELTLPSKIRVYDRYDKVFLTASLVVDPETNGNPRLIEYQGTRYVVIADRESPFTPNIPAPEGHDVSSLLLALQLVRNHLDSVLFLPPSLRRRRISEFASSCGLSVEMFHRLSDWWEWISRYIED